MARVAAHRAWRRKAAGVLAAVLLAAAGSACADEQEKPRGRPGGTPAEREVSGPGKGPYEVRTQSFSAKDVGGDLGSGTVHYPDEDGRDFAVIAASPGLGADEAMVTPYGALLASYGFVVITFNTKTLEDTPPQRGRQLLDALDYATGRSAAADRADAGRLGVLGHSMGGGGALYAASRNPDIKAAVPLTPYAARGEWPRVKASTLLIGGASDETAPVAKHAEAFYEGLSGAEEKAYLELKGDHFVATPPRGLVSRQVVAWFRHFLADDGDSATRVCRLPRTGDIVESRDTCPVD